MYVEPVEVVRPSLGASPTDSNHTVKHTSQNFFPKTFRQNKKRLVVISTFCK